jgi:LmbE family N-acetylglucosaminyl deacetylase
MSFRSKLRPLKQAAAPAAEAFAHACIAVGHFATPRNRATWSSPGGERVLVVAPHPDDEAIGCAGTLLRHAQANDRVRIAVATDGRRSRTIRDPGEMARRRREEAVDAASLLRVEQLEWIGLPECEWQTAELAAPLRALLTAFEPTVVYAPSRIDFHPEHFAVAHALALALDDCGVAPRLRVYQVQVPLTPIVTNLVVDIAAFAAECDAALRVYATQAGSLACAYRQRRYSASLYRSAGPVEEFWEMSAQCYVELHHEAPGLWPRCFRGMRNFPLTDPLAFRVGRAERRRLVAAAARSESVEPRV